MKVDKDLWVAQKLRVYFEQEHIKEKVENNARFQRLKKQAPVELKKDNILHRPAITKE